jgi:hypothetical protein
LVVARAFCCLATISDEGKKGEGRGRRGCCHLCCRRENVE